MNWSRVKSIMIFFLIGINVFLLIVFGLITYRENYIPDSVIGAAASVLASEGFPCDSDLIPNMYKSAAVLNTDFYTASELSDAFFGRQLPFRTEGYSLIAESDSDGEKLTVSGSSFAFESDRTEKSASPRKIRRALCCLLFHIVRRNHLDIEMAPCRVCPAIVVQYEAVIPYCH